MAQLEVITGLGANTGKPTAYAIAGSRLLTDADAPEFRPYQLPESAVWSGAALGQGAAAAPGDPVTYAGHGWVANAWRAVECRRAGQGFELTFPGLASFWIREDGAVVYLTAAEENVAQALLVEVALGAPVVLALALQGIFCLHVSAVELDGRLFAFAGESGQGKSTLARYLGFESGPAWRRIIDDTLPCRLTETGQIEALPHFPQLKLPDEYQPVHLVPPAMPLDALYILADSGIPVDDDILIRPLAPSAATLAVVQHTLAAKLFDRDLLARHLSFAKEFAATIPVRSLIYQRGLERLPVVQTQIERDMGDILGSR